MTISTKPEVLNILRYRQSRTEARPHVTNTKIRWNLEVRLLRYASRQTEKLIVIFACFSFVHAFSNNYVGPLYCWVKMYVGSVACVGYASSGKNGLRSPSGGGDIKSVRAWRYYRVAGHHVTENPHEAPPVTSRVPSSRGAETAYSTSYLRPLYDPAPVLDRGVARCESGVKSSGRMGVEMVSFPTGDGVGERKIAGSCICNFIRRTSTAAKKYMKKRETEKN